MNGELQFLDTSNQFFVCSNEKRNVIVMRPLGGQLTREEGLNLAAWIVVLVDPEQTDFQRLVKAIRNS